MPQARARTANVCRPTLNLNLWPEVHGLNALPSMLHSKVAPAAAEANLKATLCFRFLEETVFLGVLTSVVSGGPRWV